MTIERLIYRLPNHSKRILNILYEFSEITHDKYMPAGEVTIGTVGNELGLNKRRMSYYLKPLKELDFVNITPALGVAKITNEKQISVNADTVARSDIEELIRNV